MDIEKRQFNYKGEIRSTNGSSGMSGHAAVFNIETDLGHGIREKVAPGAFDDSIGRDDIRALINHDANLVLARNKAGTLRLREDSRGLAVEIDPPQTSYAQDLAVSMQRGDIDQMSFAFEVVKQSWEERDSYDLRVIEKAKLWDVSIVTYPAYTETDVALKCRDIWKKDNKPSGSKPWRVNIHRKKLQILERI